jgi:hypothetical protein
MSVCIQSVPHIFSQMKSKYQSYDMVQFGLLILTQTTKIHLILIPNDKTVLKNSQVLL